MLASPEMMTVLVRGWMRIHPHINREDRQRLRYMAGEWLISIN